MDTSTIWTLDGQKVQSFSGHKSYSYPLAFSPDGKNVFTGGEEGMVKLWWVKDSFLERQVEFFNPVELLDFGLKISATEFYRIISEANDEELLPLYKVSKQDGFAFDFKRLLQMQSKEALKATIEYFKWSEEREEKVEKLKWRLEKVMHQNN